MKSKEPPFEVETTEPYNWIIFEKLHDGTEVCEETFEIH